MARVHTYRFNNLTGCVTQKRIPLNNAMRSIYHNEQAHLEAEQPWSTVCELHSTMCSHRTLALARKHLTATGWCGPCMAQREAFLKKVFPKEETREERERKWESMPFTPEDAVHWVHLDKPDEPDNKVHLMIGKEEQNINLTECGTDAGLNPKEASKNSVTSGDLCLDCLANFVYRVKHQPVCAYPGCLTPTPRRQDYCSAHRGMACDHDTLQVGETCPSCGARLLERGSIDIEKLKARLSGADQPKPKPVQLEAHVRRVCPRCKGSMR